MSTFTTYDRPIAPYEAATPIATSNPVRSACHSSTGAAYCQPIAFYSGIPSLTGLRWMWIVLSHRFLHKHD